MTGVAEGLMAEVVVVVVVRMSVAAVAMMAAMAMIFISGVTWMMSSKIALSGIQTVQGSRCEWLSVSTAPFRLSVCQSLSTLTSMPAPVASRVGNRPEEITPGLWNSTRTDSRFVSLPEGPIQGREGPNRRLTVVHSG